MTDTSTEAVNARRSFAISVQYARHQDKVISTTSLLAVIRSADTKREAIEIAKTLFAENGDIPTGFEEASTTSLEIEDPLVPALLSERDAAIARAEKAEASEKKMREAALDFIAKVDRGEARSTDSYAKFTAALEATS